MDDLFVKVNEKTTGRALAQNLHLNAPAEALCLEKNGRIVDLDTEITPEDEIRFISFDSEEGREVFWHSSAHILAQAVLRLFPEANPTIGPAIEQGFYYDFANLSLSEHDLERIEKEMEKIAQENHKPMRRLFSGKQEALAHFDNNPFKKELIDSFGEEDPITGYTQGEFFDLCRGPHISSLGKVKALKLLKVSGAYWRGDKENPMLTRIYGISFPDKKQLKEYLFQIEEAKKRDHKVLGPKLGLFSLKEEAPGMPFIHGKGLIVWNGLLSFIRSLLDKHSYEEIKTPTLMSRELWERSGHWKNYRQNMFTSEIEERDFAIKPMNCPGCILYYAGTRHSYREFPLRIAEIGNVHRYEASGALSGLFRVRSFHQDDAHIFMRPQDIEDEILNVLNLADEIYQTFGLSYHLELSTRPEKDTIGSDEEWETATKGLKGALDRSGKPYKINPGDGAFYGPKIDFHIKDALKRTWQCGTIQLDMSLPERFDLTYDDADGTQKRPVMIHRAIFGSVERFLGILIEHFAGRFPLWLSPRQIRILPVADRHVEAAEKLKTQLKEQGFHVDVDASHESVSKKVRLAQIEQVNYILTIGDKELEEGTLALRTRQGAIFQGLSYEKFLTTLLEERETKSLESLFS